MAKSKTPNKRISVPETLKIESEWGKAGTKALQKKRPEGDWPKD